jgi:hypothetical protein
LPAGALFSASTITDDGALRTPSWAPGGGPVFRGDMIVLPFAGDSPDLVTAYGLRNVPDLRAIDEIASCTPAARCCRLISTARRVRSRGWICASQPRVWCSGGCCIVTRTRTTSRVDPIWGAAGHGCRSAGFDRVEYTP